MIRTRWCAAAPMLLLALLHTGAAARSTPNPPGRVILDPDAPLAAPLGVSSTQFVNVPLASGAVQLDSTWYDLQDMGSLGPRVVVAPDGTVHVSWHDDFCELSGTCPPNLAAPQPYPYRGMGYAYRDPDGAWHRLGKVSDPALHQGCCVGEWLGGFGALAVTPGGRAVVAQHMNEDGCDDRADFYLESAPGASTWQGYLSPIVDPSPLFPQVTANPNGSFTLLGEEPRGGSYDEVNKFWVSSLAAPGAVFTCPFGWQTSTWRQPYATNLFPDGKPAFPSMAVSSNGRVGIAVGDFGASETPATAYGGNVWLIESSDGTFQPGTITTRNLTNYSNASITRPDSSSTEWRPYIHCHLAYNDTTPVVVWSELQVRRVGGNVAFFDWHSRIRMWSPTRGLETVYQVPAGVADHFDDFDNGLNGPLAGFNTISVDWPQVGFSADGSETYVAFLRASDAEIDPTADIGLPGQVTGIAFMDIAATVTRAGEGFAPPQNLTQTPNTDERFFSLATRNPGGVLHLTGIASATDQAGVVLIGDRGATPGNILRRVFYLERRLSASVLDAPGTAPENGVRLTAAPNPAPGSLGVRFDAGAGTRGALEVFDLNGRRMARLPLAADGGARWNGRDSAGAPAPAGVYFARLTDSPTTRTRFVLAR